MKYQIVLTSVLWDPSYQNVRRFGSRTDQETYFDVAHKFTSAVPVRNLDYANFTRLSVLVKTGQAGIGDIMSANYAIIKDITNANAPKYWYYFIVNSTFDSVDQVRLDLEMDVMQCYYIDMTFNEAMIERAHLNRWSEVTTGTFIFGQGVDNNFLTRDELRDLPKRVKSVSKAVVSPFTPDHDVSKWLDANVLCWVYVYLDAGSYGTVDDTFDEQLTYIRGTGAASTRVKSPYVVLAAPIMSNVTHAVRLGSSNVNFYTISSDSLFSFLDSYMANVYAIKLSAYPPFDASASYTITGLGALDNIYLNVYGNNYEHLPEVHVTSTGTHIAHVRYQNLSADYLTKAYTLPQRAITKASLSTYTLDRNANPKAFNSDYRELKLTYCGNEYSFDIQKVWHSVGAGASSVNFKFFEVLTPEIAPSFITIDVTDGGVYYKPYENKIGYLAQNDLSIPYSKNQLDVFLANNKNFFLQKQENYTTQRTQRAISGFANVLSGAGGAVASGVSQDYGAAVRQGIGTLGGVVTSILDSELSILHDQITTKYTLDNMQAGVDSLTNSNSNAFFNLGISDLKIMIQETEALPIDLNRALEEMFENGYSYNRMGNIKSFDNIRSKWNYVKALVEVITTPVKIPNEVRNKIKEIFARGVRFWNTDTWTYNQLNLENS